MLRIACSITRPMNSNDHGDHISHHNRDELADLRWPWHADLRWSWHASWHFGMRTRLAIAEVPLRFVPGAVSARMSSCRGSLDRRGQDALAQHAVRDADVRGDLG